MAPLTTSQKTLVSQFCAFTRADKRVAEKVLRQYSWNVQQAVDGYFHSAQGAQRSTASDPALNKIFDKYRDDPANSPDTIQMQGAMAYFGEIGVSIEDVGLLVASELLDCPALGDIPRAGFLAGWGPLAATNLPAQKSQIAHRLTSLKSPEARAQSGLFRRVYKHTFKLACPPGSKSVPLDVAAEFWKMLFGPLGLPWISQDSTDWLELYLSFLTERWKKAVNRDLWDQTLLFALKTLEDDSLGWWSEDGAWPGVIDEFVEHAKTRPGATSATAMEIE